MPTKDYFPFTEFDIGTDIPFILTKEEKDDENRQFSNIIRVEEDIWCLCIFWIDKDRMFMSLECNYYYFKQIGKNVHLFELIFQCT